MSGNDGKGDLVSKGREIPGETETKSDRCRYCGSTIQMNEWHPVIADDDGDEFRIHAFCDERCRMRWDG